MKSVDDSPADAAMQEGVRNVIRETALCLDHENLAGWLDLFAESSSYEMTSFSPEIRTQMVWWRSNRVELSKLLEEVHQHVRDPARRLHLVTPMSVQITGGRATAISHFAIYRTLPEGESGLFAVGRYEDDLTLAQEGWRYSLHRAVLDTRVLDAFTHLPL